MKDVRPREGLLRVGFKLSTRRVWAGACQVAVAGCGMVPLGHHAPNKPFGQTFRCCAPQCALAYVASPIFCLFYLYPLTISDLAFVLHSYYLYFTFYIIFDSAILV